MKSWTKKKKMATGWYLVNKKGDYLAGPYTTILGVEMAFQRMHLNADDVDAVYEKLEGLED